MLTAVGAPVSALAAWPEVGAAIAAALLPQVIERASRRDLRAGRLAAAAADSTAMVAHPLLVRPAVSDGAERQLTKQGRDRCAIVYQLLWRRLDE